MESNNNTAKKLKIKVNNMKIIGDDLIECPYCKCSKFKLDILNWLDTGTVIACDNCGAVFKVVTPKTLNIETITEPQKFLIKAD